MGWTNELYRIYELNSRREVSTSEDRLLPVSHSTANAQIEVIIDEYGELTTAARQVDKSNALTIIPVTEDSGARSSGICPMPLADKLVYIAGDYSKFAPFKHKDDANKFSAYMAQLQKWKDSPYSHLAVNAIFTYLQKCELMQDLIESGVLQVDAETGKLLEKVKISGIPQEDSFVRFIVEYDDMEKETCTWKDTTLYESFIAFNASQMGNQQLCYATGKILPVTYKHPSKIRNGGDKAKLISSNDESGFTYRGRFCGKEEAISVSYDFSQKMHNALKWLIQKQGKSYGSLTLLIWASALQDLPDELGFSPIEDKYFDENHIPDTKEKYAEQLSKYLTGYRQKFQNDTKIMIMGLDSATTGRLSISIYDEFHSSEFLNNLQQWHEHSAWRRYRKFGKDGEGHNVIMSFSLYEIIRSAYGTEQNGKLECDDKLVRGQILRLLPCVMNSAKIPEDLIWALYHKASNPLAYDKKYNHHSVLEVACGMINASKKGVFTMGFDPNQTNRSYLFGCLLAIADKAESDTYEKEEKNSRVTNARRYWNAFSQHPYQTWGIIEERLQPYLNQHKHRTFMLKQIQDIMDKLTVENFQNNTRLEPLYLLGYHHFTAYLYLKQDKNKEENENESITE